MNSEIGDNRAKIGEYENLLKDVQQTAKHDRERLEHELKTVKLLEDKIVSISSLLEDQTNAFEVERQDLLSSRDTLQAKLDSLKQQETSQKVFRERLL